MKNSKYFIAATTLTLAVASPFASADELVVVVENIKDTKGSLFISIYDNEVSFESNNNATKRQRINVNSNSMSIKFDDLPTGEYAVKVFHDVNENGAMDFSGGIPAEPFGSSSKSKEMAPPKFGDAKFMLDKHQQIQIHLIK